MQPVYFIGYDSREHEAASICAWSIAEKAKEPATIYFMEHRTLRRLGLFRRTWHIDAGGQYYDDLDGKPHSTGFSFSRFLVFHLAKELGLTGPCAFLDCDFIFLADPAPLMAEQASKGDRIGVLPRNTAGTMPIKMDGMKQEGYPRKLWSAFFTFNPSDELAETFSPEVVNTAPGSDLHAFLGRPESGFWHYDPLWHVIPTMDGDNMAAKVLHYSEWSPWINPEKMGDTPKTRDYWFDERQRFYKAVAESGNFTWVSSLEDDILAARAKKAA